MSPLGEQVSRLEEENARARRIMDTLTALVTAEGLGGVGVEVRAADAAQERGSAIVAQDFAHQVYEAMGADENTGPAVVLANMRALVVAKDAAEASVDGVRKHFLAIEKERDSLKGELAIAWGDCGDGTCHACAKCFDAAQAETAALRVHRDALQIDFDAKAGEVEDLRAERDAIAEAVGEAMNTLADAGRIEEKEGTPTLSEDIAELCHAVSGLIKDLECAQAGVTREKAEPGFLVVKRVAGAITWFMHGRVKDDGSAGWSTCMGMSTDGNPRFATLEDAEVEAKKITKNADGSKMPKVVLASIGVATVAEGMAANRAWDERTKDAKGPRYDTQEGNVITGGGVVVTSGGTAVATPVDGAFVIMRTVPKLGRQVFVEGEPHALGVPHVWVSADELDRATRYPTIEDADRTKRVLGPVLRRTRVISLRDIVALPPAVPKEERNDEAPPVEAAAGGAE